MTSLTGQIGVVTGASRGLGRHIALRLAREGVRVALLARAEDELRGVAEEIASAGGEALAQALDIRDYAAVERAVALVKERFGSIDILVNNAGVGWYKPFEEWSVEEIDLTLDVNLKGTIYATRVVLPMMTARGAGQIINIASDLGRRVVPGMAPYVASKFGVLGFAGSLLREVKAKGVKVMTVTPGLIDTFFGGGAEGTKDESWSLRPEFLAGVIVDLLKLPRHVMVDELSIHAMGQDF